jgi:hypothetical protein
MRIPLAFDRDAGAFDQQMRRAVRTKIPDLCLWRLLAPAGGAAFGTAVPQTDQSRQARGDPCRLPERNADQHPPSTGGSEWRHHYHLSQAIGHACRWTWPIL